jgi:PAS domain S-box-containing protein
MTEETRTGKSPIEEEFEELLTGDGVVSLSPQWSVMGANLQAERLLKTKLEPGLALRPEQIFTPKYLPQAELAVREALQGGHSRSNLRAEVKNGLDSVTAVLYSVFPIFDADRRILGLTLTFQEAGSAAGIRTSGGLGLGVAYDALVENLAEGVFTINNRWLITSFNQRAQDITGFKREEVMGRYCWDVFQSDLCRTGCPLRTTLETGVQHMDQDVRIFRKQGRRLSILVNTSVLKDKRDQVIGAVETFRPLSGVMGNDQSVEAEPEPVLIIGQDPVLVKLLNMLPDVARSETSVVIEGESGTGKELIARAIHAKSLRNGGPFVAVNTSALAETLLESELFGHEKAAFTGAINSKVGRFELARGGTLFLDEITDIKPEIQVKLLRVLEERVFERVGGTRSIAMDARIISATNRSLIDEVRKGRFRQDLFYRLRTVPVWLPPLRERTGDIPVLVEHFLGLLNDKYQKRVRGIDPKVMSAFKRYQWPGNIRELQRVLEYAFVFVKGPVITSSHLPEMEEEPGEAVTVKQVPPFWEDERASITEALARTGGKKAEAARLLGLSRSSLWRKMRDHGL